MPATDEEGKLLPSCETYKHLFEISRLALIGLNIEAASIARWYLALQEVKTHVVSGSGIIWGEQCNANRLCPC